MIFEAVVGSTVSGYIAIDDITITAGACQDAGQEFLCVTHSYLHLGLGEIDQIAVESRNNISRNFCFSVLG